METCCNLLYRISFGTTAILRVWFNILVTLSQEDPISLLGRNQIHPSNGIITEGPISRFKNSLKHMHPCNTSSLSFLMISTHGLLPLRNIGKNLKTLQRRMCWQIYIISDLLTLYVAIMYPYSELANVNILSYFYLFIFKIQHYRPS